MNDPGDPKSGPGAKPLSPRDQRLAKALRDNLRRRKVPPVKPPAEDSGDKNPD
jgi:hypothetical protein